MVSNVLPLPKINCRSIPPRLGRSADPYVAGGVIAFTNGGAFQNCDYLPSVDLDEVLE